MQYTFRLDQDWNVAILGFHGTHVREPNTTLDKLRTELGQDEVQVLRADRIAGTQHLLIAAQNALAAFRQNRTMSKTLAMETLLYASGQRQISKAISLLGVNQNSREVILIIFSKQNLDETTLERGTLKVLGGQREDSAVDFPEGEEGELRARSLRTTYKVTDLELEAASLPGETRRDALTRLIVERTVLLSIN